MTAINFIPGDLEGLLRDLIDAGVEEASDIEPEYRPHIVRLWSADADYESLQHAYLAPYPESDKDEARFEQLVRAAFRRLDSGAEGDAEFLRLLDNHLWYEIEDRIDELLRDLESEPTEYPPGTLGWYESMRGDAA